MIRIEHVAIWVEDIERSKMFFEKYFNAIAGDKYVNTKKNFMSYFVSFPDGPRLELMTRPDIHNRDVQNEYFGLAHFAVSLGSKENVDTLTEQFRKDGFTILDGPRTTGDGYYESVILDGEGNRIELTV